MQSFNPLLYGYQQSHIDILDHLIDRTSKDDLVRLTTYLRRYISPSITSRLFIQSRLDSLLEQQTLQDIAALVLDIRGFVHTTQTGERTVGLASIAEFLQKLFSRSIGIAFDNEGLIGEFAGDRLLITFGFPSFNPDLASSRQISALQALRTAIGIQQAVERIKKDSGLLGFLSSVNVGIGICQGGPAWIGDIGTNWRRELTVISTVVNMASRAEELTKDDDLMRNAPRKKIVANKTLIDQVLHQVGHAALITRDLGKIKMRGLEEEIPFFHVIDVKDEVFASSSSIRPGDTDLANWLCEYIEGAVERKVAVQVHRALSDIGQIVTSVPEQKTTLDQILNEIVRILNVRNATLYRVDPLTAELIFESIVSDSEHPPERGSRLDPGTGIVGWVVEHKERVRISDVQKDKRWYRGKTGSDIHSMLCVPLIVQDQVIGAIQVMDKEPARFSASDLDMLMAFAGSAAMAMENARLYELAYSSTAAQHKITKALTGSLELAEVLDTIMEVLKDRLAAKSATLYQVDPLTGELIFASVISDSEHPPARGFRLNPGTGIVGWVVEHREHVRISDVGKDARWYGKFGSDIRSMLCVPLVVQDQVVGAIQVMDKRPNVFSQDALEFLEWLAASAAVAVDNAAKFQALRKAKEELESTHRKLIASDTMAALGDITGKLAHTLTNQISAIQYFAEHVLLKHEDEEVREYAGLILENTRPALDEIRRIRDPLIGWTEEKVNVNAVLGELVKEVRRELLAGRRTEVEIQINYQDADRPLFVTSSQGRIKYIFRNLVDNAVRAIQEKGVAQGHLTIRSTWEDKDGKALGMIKVIDNGKGISPANLNRVFELGFTTRPEGTVGGYGLFWVRLTVERIGGTIFVESKAGKGTVFTVSLPLIENHAGGPVA